MAGVPPSAPDCSVMKLPVPPSLTGSRVASGPAAVAEDIDFGLGSFPALRLRFRFLRICLNPFVRCKSEVACSAQLSSLSLFSGYSGRTAHGAQETLRHSTLVKGVDYAVESRQYRYNCKIVAPSLWVL